ELRAEGSLVGDIVECHARADDRTAVSEQRRDLDLETPNGAVGRRVLDTGDGDRPAVARALIDRSAQVYRPLRELEVFESPADVAGANAKQPAGMLVGESQVAEGIDNHVGEGRCLRGQLVQ